MCYDLNGCAPFFVLDSNPTTTTTMKPITNVFH